MAFALKEGEEIVRANSRRMPSLLPQIDATGTPVKRKVKDWVVLMLALRPLAQVVAEFNLGCDVPVDILDR